MKRKWGKPIYKPICWIFKHKWMNWPGDYTVCSRCDKAKFQRREFDGIKWITEEQVAEQLDYAKNHPLKP